MAPIFKPLAEPAPAQPVIPRAMQTALFLHRIQQSLKPSKPEKAHANGHPIIHAPIVVRPARAVHKTPTQLY